MGNSIRKYAMLLKYAKMVPFQKNLISDLEFAQALRKGYRMVFGKDPTLEILAGAWAQGVLESGRPIKLPNNNVGNIKATPEWISQNDFFVKDAKEYTKDGKKFIETAAKWRSYPTLEEGAAGYWKLLGNPRYNKAINWMAAGDPKSASVVLGVNGYFTGNISKYANYSNVLYNEFMNKLAPKFPDLASNPAPPPGEKPEIKNFTSDYSKEEKEAIKTDATTQKQENVTEDHIEELIGKLYANEGILSKLVKNSILKEKLTSSNVLICVNGNSLVNKLEFARIASKILKTTLDANVAICHEGNNIEIECSTYGTEKAVVGAVDELCNVITKIMKKHKYQISTLVIPGLISKYSEITYDKLIKNRKQFNINRILNG